MNKPLLTWQVGPGSNCLRAYWRGKGLRVEPLASGGYRWRCGRVQAFAQTREAAQLAAEAEAGVVRVEAPEVEIDPELQAELLHLERCAP